MAKTSQLRFSSSYEVIFPDFPSFKTQPQSVKLYQEQGKHDVVELKFGVLDTFYEQSLKTGVAVKITWTNGLQNGIFNGYVHSVTTLTQTSVTRDTVITCVGAGFVLKEGGTKVWNNKTASQIVQDICKEVNLKPIVTPHPHVYSQQSLTGQTRWEKIQELAQRIGYVCQVYGVDLHFHPIDNMIDAFASSIPVLSYYDMFFNAFDSDSGHTLDIFKPTISDINETSKHIKRDKTVSGIDVVTGKPYSYTSKTNTVGIKVREKTTDTIFQEVVPTRVTEDVTAAKLMAEAFSQLARFSIHAEGQAQGNPLISPYRTIEISGTGDSTDGYWIVTKATHTIMYDGRYSTEFTCVTDGLGKNNQTNSRPANAQVIPTLNVGTASSTGISTVATTAKLSSQTQMINQTSTGFNVLPRRWVA